MIGRPMYFSLATVALRSQQCTTFCFNPSNTQKM